MFKPSFPGAQLKALRELIETILNASTLFRGGGGSSHRTHLYTDFLDQVREHKPQMPPPPHVPQGMVYQPYGSLPGLLDDVERHDVDPRDQDPRKRRMSGNQFLEDL